MNIFNYTRNLFLGSTILLGVGLIQPLFGRSEVTGGVAASVSLNAGTLNQNAVGVLPVLWISQFIEREGGWDLNIDYSNSTPDKSTGLKYAARTACWVLRTSDIRFFQRTYRVGGGIGFGLWNYSLYGENTYRGSPGFVAEIGSKYELAGISGINLEMGYSGLNVPGTGRVDDILYFRIRYQLFSTK